MVEHAETQIPTTPPSDENKHFEFGYLLPLANLAAQTEFSQWGKVCSG